MSARTREHAHMLSYQEHLTRAFNAVAHGACNHVGFPRLEDVS
jgi:hypothetical protein